jgi:hypothetical protein
VAFLKQSNIRLVNVNFVVGEQKFGLFPGTPERVKIIKRKQSWEACVEGQLSFA